MAGICSFFIPGLGQLITGRLISSTVWFFTVYACYVLAVVTLGMGLLIAFPMHIACIIHAVHCDREQQRKTMEQAIRNAARR